MLPKQFSASALTKILEQAAIYDCACPAQICDRISSLRALYDYQDHCLDLTDTDRKVHSRIAEAVSTAHAQMEDCLADVLKLEGWDMKTLQMPTDMQKRLLKSITDG
jgi:hypothetical protein